MNPASATGVASLKLSDALLQHPNPHPQRLGLVLDPPNQCAATEGDPNDYQGAHSSRTFPPSSKPRTTPVSPSASPSARGVPVGIDTMSCMAMPSTKTVSATPVAMPYQSPRWGGISARSAPGGRTWRSDRWRASWQRVATGANEGESAIPAGVGDDNAGHDPETPDDGAAMNA